MTLQEFWSALTINTKEKIKNPFFGSLALVWIFRHHAELYRLLFCYQDHKTEMAYLNSLFIVDWSLICLILKALLVMIISYAILAGTNFGLMIYNNRTIPWLSDKASKGATVVEKVKYENLQKEYSAINEKHDKLIEERNNAVSKRLDLQQERDSAKLQMQEANIEKATAVQKAQILENEKVRLSDELNNMTAQSASFEKLFVEERRLKESQEITIKMVQEDLQKAIEDLKGKDHSIGSLVNDINDWQDIAINYFIELFLPNRTSKTAAAKMFREINDSTRLDVHPQDLYFTLVDNRFITKDGAILKVSSLGQRLLAILNQKLATSQ